MRKRLATMAAAASLLGALFGAAPASAEFGLKDLDVTFTDQNGAPSMEAGSHPFDWISSFNVNSVEREGFDADGGPEMITFPDDTVRDALVEFSPGLIGDPFAAPRCESVDFVAYLCPDSSVVGTARVRITLGGPPPSGPGNPIPLFNLVPGPGRAARFGFIVAEANYPVTIDANLNPDPPYNIVAGATNISQATFVFGSDVTVWGNPADSAHDAVRCGVGRTAPCPANVSERAFTVMPRRCTGPLATHIRTRSWQEPDNWLTYDLLSHDDAVPPNPQGTGGCGRVGFAPTIESQSTTDQAEAPSGLAFELRLPNPGLQNPDGIANSDLKRAVVALPEGVTINPSQAEGLVTCAPAQFARETADSRFGDGCPQASKIGDVEVESPLLEDTILRGSAFVATQDDPNTTTPGAENPFDSLIGLYLTIKEPRYGIGIRLAGKVAPDPKTGQIVTTFGDPSGAGGDFDELPQLPFTEFRLRLREGARSPLITPPTCGTYETEAGFTPWANPGSSVPAKASFEVTEGVGAGPCPSGGTQPFEPGFDAGTQSNSAATYSPFNMRLTRRDGDQDLTRFDATLPQGVVGKLAGLTQCPQAAVEAAKAKTGKAEKASPSCPASSEIGNVMAGAGVGSVLVYVPGKVYLAGPFGGAPISVVGVVPAVAGPFDVGTVVTQQALEIDPKTALVKANGAKSDPIPHILAGIPLRVKDIQVYVDKPNFILNPTSCDPMATNSDIWGGGFDVFSIADDSPVARSARYQAANCGSLGFKPRLVFRLKGGTRRGDHPAFTATLTPRPGDANIAGASAALPRSEFLENAHIRTICTRAQFASETCPAGAIYGYARATTPLLDDPVQGPVYLRSSSNLLPDLVADFRGPPSLPIRFELVGRTDSINGGIRNTFDVAPDVPVTSFTLALQGGKKGLLVNSRDICGRAYRAKVVFKAHNGKRAVVRPKLQAQCGKKGKKKSRAHRRHR